MKRVIVLLWACLSSTLLLANHWTPDNPGAYAFVMGVTSVVEINDVEQTSDQLEVGAFCGTQCRGSQMAAEFSLTGRYLVMMTVYGDVGDEISFRLYDHSTGQELDGVGLTTVVFSQDGYGTPLQPITIGFHTNLNITVTATPASGGTVTGGGSYLYSTQCTITASPNTGYDFVNWTLNGSPVSNSLSYTFTVSAAAEYVAHFQIQSFQITANASPTNGGTVSGAGTYDYGQTCTLTATPATGYTFINWTRNGTVVSTDPSYAFTVTEGAAYEAHFQIQSFQIAANANPTNGGTVQGAGTYNYGQTCTLTATAATGYDFVNWTLNGNPVSTNPSYAFTVTEAGTYVANFQIQSFQITATATPTNGGTVQGAATYNYGQTCTLTATPATGYNFVNWTKGNTVVSDEASISFTVTEAGAYVAHFQIQSFQITATATPSNGGTVSGAGTFDYGQTCTLTAIPATGYSFVNWTKGGEVVSQVASFNFTVTEAGAYVAHFQIQSFQINVTANPTEAGTVSGGGSYEYGQTCTLTATPATGYDFVNWTLGGVEVSTDLSYSFTVTEAAAYVANFQTQSFQITATANPTNGGTVQGAGSYEYNTQCTLTATAATGYSFVNWTKGGEVVSNQATYNFTVTEAGAYVANFQIQSYEITATANIEGAGTVTGAGTYEYGSECTLTATPATGYVFVSWLRNNIYVSNSASYTFTVTGPASYVARFAEEGYFENHWTPVTEPFQFYMALTAVVEINGDEQTSDWLEVGAFCGEQCRGSQIMQESFTGRHIVMMNVYGEEGDTFTFRLYDHSIDQEVEATCLTTVDFSMDDLGTPLEPYVLEFSSATPPTVFTITATVNPENSGTVAGAGTYASGAQCTLTATAAEGYSFVNWTLNSEVIGTVPTLTFTVTADAAYVANFEAEAPSTVTQTTQLANGWSWWSTYIEMEGVDGLTMLESSLGNYGDQILSRNNGFVNRLVYGSYVFWSGSLSALANDQMYMIKTNQACEATMTGSVVDVENTPITIVNGWNWIGYLNSQSISITEALSQFSPVTGDQIKGRNGYATYTTYGPYGFWSGSLNALEPGQGYMYLSNSQDNKTVYYSEGREAEPGQMFDNLLWTPSSEQYAHNMTVTSVIDLDGAELRSEDYELAAFVGDECRGSVKLMYVEPIDRYIAFLLVFGEETEDLRFVLSNGNGTSWSQDSYVYSNDATVGTIANPVTLHFSPMGVEDNASGKANVYPNPSNGIFTVEGKGVRIVEVFNGYGQLIHSEKVEDSAVQLDLSDRAIGTYLLRVVTDKDVIFKKIIKNN